MYITSCTLDWHRLPHRTARSLVLLIAVSTVPVKITAGKFMDLSLNSFGAVSVFVLDIVSRTILQSYVVFLDCADIGGVSEYITNNQRLSAQLVIRDQRAILTEILM